MNHSVTVHRPNEFRDIRIGPIQHAFNADTLAQQLRSRMAETAHLPGTTISTGPYDPTQQHLPVIDPLDPGTLAEWIHQRPAHRTEAEAFPTLHDRTFAQLPEYEATTLWRDATRIHDAFCSQDHDTEPDPTGPLTAAWTDLVTTPHDPAEPTVVHLVLGDGRTAELLLDEEHREALGLLLVDPSMPDVDTDDEPARPGPRPRRRGTAASRLALRRRNR